MIHWIDTRHWGRVMLTHATWWRMYAPNWLEIGAIYTNVWRKCIRKWIIKNCTFSVFRCKGICRNSDDNARVPLWNMLSYSYIGLLPVLMKCYNQPKVNALSMMGWLKITIIDQVLHYKKKKILLAYRQTIGMPVLWGLALKCIKQTWKSKDQKITVMSSGNIHA